jgi:hypothetical protein
MQSTGVFASRETSSPGRRTGIRFDRNECAGAFGDMGTDIPLLIGVTLAAGLPYGYVVALLVGTVLAHLGERARLVSLDSAGRADEGGGCRVAHGDTVGA